jgi:DNA-binding PadR family transcriptional regulator
MSPVFAHGRLRLYILKLLDESPRHGYDVIRLLEDRFLGLYAPSAGTVYPRLQRLEKEGLVTHDEQEGRKIYRLTDTGRAELAANADELAALEEEIVGSVRELAAEVRSDVHGSARSLREELKQAARDVRRVERSEGRWSATGRELKAFELELERFRHEARMLARSPGRSSSQLSAGTAAFDELLTRLRKAFGDPA